MLKQHLKMLKRVENKFLSYLASLAPEERERHIVDFHVTYARANKPPAKKKTPLKSKNSQASNTNNLDQPESIPNKRGRKKLPRDSFCLKLEKKNNAEIS